ncbi:MAG: hypothetical protein LBD77_08590 [Bifidobacteriaceae bacterium]|jgi:hypothetical protein|nr:hypothetical protein [Bifidobacteriaceae bacterium]
MAHKPLARFSKALCGAVAIALVIAGITVPAPAAATGEASIPLDWLYGLTNNECLPTAESSNARTSGTRCVNGTRVRSRGFNRCLRLHQHPPAVAVYAHNECYGSTWSEYNYIEAIAQARLVQWLNEAMLEAYPGEGVYPLEVRDVAGDKNNTAGTAADRLSATVNQSDGIVTGSIQWELRTSRPPGETHEPDSSCADAEEVCTDPEPGGDGRADVVMVGPDWKDSKHNTVWVIELKQGRLNSSTAKDARLQAGSYVSKMRANLGWYGARVADMSGYEDQFHVAVECKDALGQAVTSALWTFYVGGGDGGEVMVYSEKDPDCARELAKDSSKYQTARDRVNAAQATAARPQALPGPLQPPAPFGGDEHGNVSPIEIATLIRAAAGLAQQAARWQWIKDTICLGPVNVAVRTAGDGSVSVAALQCLEAANLVQLASVFDRAAAFVFTVAQFELIYDAVFGEGDQTSPVAAACGLDDPVAKAAAFVAAGYPFTQVDAVNVCTARTGGGSGGGGSGTSPAADPNVGGSQDGADRAEDEVPAVSSDPIIVDVAGDGFAPTTVAAGAYFDLNVDGYAERINWIQADDQVLAWDRDGNRKIDNGLEVFGDSTRLASGQMAGSGYVALAELDSNGNNAIDPGDAHWADLVLWADSANPGRTDVGELQTLDELAVKSISLETVRMDQSVDVGVVLGEASAVVIGDGLIHQAAEYWVSTVHWDTVEADLDDGYGIPWDVLGLPNVRAFGTVPSLHRAVMADSTGRVRELIEGFGASGETAEREALVLELVLRITAADQVPPGSRGTNFDAQKLAAIEAILGRKFNGASGPNPNAQAAMSLDGVWTRLYEVYYCELLYQTHLRDFREVLAASLITDGRLDVSGLVEAVQVLDGEAPETEQLLADLGRLLFYFQQGHISGLADLVAAMGPASIALYRDMPQISSMMWFGTDGKDTISTTAGWPTAYGMGGNDTLNGSAWADALYGGAGDDALSGNAGDDLIDGGAGDDSVWAGDGADVLVGGPGDDSLSGGNGSDRYELSGGGADVVVDYDSDSVVVMPAGVGPGSVSAARSGSYGLGLSWGSGSVVFYRWFAYTDGRGKFAELRFDDGTVWTVEDVKALAPV